LYFQDESRFGLATHIGKCLTAKGIKPILPYQHKFDNTYLYGSFSPITGDQFVWEIGNVNCEIFEAYLQSMSTFKPDEYKIVVIDNARFHSTKNITIPENIHLINIPPYTPELNPCEQVWQYLKQRFKNKVFSTIDCLKEWLYDSVEMLDKEIIKSITSNHHYLDVFYTTFNM